MTETKTTRKEKEKLRHKEEILEAALSLFSSKGFHNVSMQEIADKSEFAVGTLYNFFDSKESLFEGLMNHFGENIIHEVMEILDGPGNERECLVNLFRSSSRLLEKYSAVIKLHTSVLGAFGITPVKIRDESKVYEKLNCRIKNLIEQGINNGIFRDVDPEIASMAINATISTLSHEVAGHFDKDKVTDMFKKVEQLFLNGLLISKTMENQ